MSAMGSTALDMLECVAGVDCEADNLNDTRNEQVKNKRIEQAYKRNQRSTVNNAGAPANTEFDTFVSSDKSTPHPCNALSHTKGKNWLSYICRKPGSNNFKGAACVRSYDEQKHLREAAQRMSGDWVCRKDNLNSRPWNNSL